MSLISRPLCALMAHRIRKDLENRVIPREYKDYVGIERVQMRIDERLSNVVALATGTILLALLLVYTVFFIQKTSNSIHLILASLFIGLTLLLIRNLSIAYRLKPFAVSRNAVEVAFQGVYYPGEKFNISVSCTSLDIHLKQQAELSWFMPTSQGPGILLCRIQCIIKNSLRSDSSKFMYSVEGSIPESVPSTESEKFRVYAQLRLKTKLANYDFQMNIGLNREGRK
jgi:predicted membrane channel-forming protein YqfA (hemolysin III family)